MYVGSYHSTAGDEARLRNSRIENSLESRSLTRFSTSWSLNEGLKETSQINHRLPSTWIFKGEI